MNLDIYTDGSFKQGRGSWAFVFVADEKILIEKSGHQKKTSSLRMELRAVKEALLHLAPKSIATLYCDCRIVIDALTDEDSKQKQGPVGPLIEELIELSKNHDLKWQWVKAHAGNPYNERCDDLCIIARTPRSPTLR